MKAKTLTYWIFLFSILVIFPSICFAQNEPLSPKDLYAEVTDSVVTLKWTPPIDTSISGFNIYRKEDSSKDDFTKINSQLMNDTAYRDSGVTKGKSYTYICKSVNSDGIESQASNVTGAPKMKMNASAVVTHMGRAVRIAVPGDVITYDIAFVNQGFGLAKDVVIVYAIPKGTTFISGTAKSVEHKALVTYYSEKEGKWVDSVSDENDISKIKFAIAEDIPPANKDKSGIASLKVLVNY